MDMAVAKVAAMNGGATKAGCVLAVLLLARFATAQNGPETAVRTAPEAPAAAVEPGAVSLKISYVGGQLKINAFGSTLADVLTQVAALTGVTIDIPASANGERMPVVELGPGPARQILASLLSDSNFDYLIQASDADPERIQALLLMPREKKGSGTNAGRGPVVAAAAPPEPPVADSPAPPQPEMPAPEARSVNPSPTTAPPTPVTPDAGQFPLLQPDTTNPAKPGALTPPATLNQESINQQLQQMYQQRMQMTQQDHFTGTQPVPLIPGVNK
jgi:hypothetical protein